MKTRKLIANICRYSARYTLLIIGILVFIFALLSGSESEGGGIMGILKNSPNAIPWLVLLILVLIAWKWELIGGILITIIGLVMVYYFNFSGPNFTLLVFIMTILIAMFGSFFIISWYLRKKIIIV